MRALVLALIALVVVLIGAVVAFVVFGDKGAPSLQSASADGPTAGQPLNAPGSTAQTGGAVTAANDPKPGLGPVKSQHGDWQIRCNTPPGSRAEQCALIQNVTAEDRPNVGLSVIVLKTVDKKARILRVLAPLGVLIPSGLGLKIDAADIGRTPFVRCLPNGCIAEVVIDDNLMNQLRNGQLATFSIFQTPEEGIGIPISLASFGEGFDKLP